MTPEQWTRLKTIFQDALDQPMEGRRVWLTGACGGDAELLREAGALLLAHDTAGDFLEEPAQVDPDEVETLLPGSHLGPDYLINGILGRGGMGIVYLAHDFRLGRRVALKALPASVAANEQLRERLRREARAVATISHHAVATVYALEEINGDLYMATEYVPGHTLSSEIAQGPMPPDRARAIALEVTRALVAAHEAGVIHRDLKPDNVLIHADGVKVVDFGIAHIEGPESTRLTKAGAMLGTPAYMAPEQLLGGAIDARADLYAFGVMLSEMLTGRHPLNASGPGNPVQVPAGFTTVINRCLQPDPAARFASARELLQVIEEMGRLKAAPTSDHATPGTGLTWGPPSAVADALADRRDGPRQRTVESALSGRVAERPDPGGGWSGGPTTTARWWWEFHQAMAALVYVAMIYPAWLGRTALGGQWGRAFFILTLAGVIVSVTLRLHLWFTSRSYPDQLDWAHGRNLPWLRIADWAFVLTLTAGGIAIGDSPLGVLLISVAIGVGAAFLVVEPVTTRAAFKSEGKRPA